MADKKGNPPDNMSLEEELTLNPWKFDFYQALRLLECSHKESPGIGRADGVSGEFVRLTQEPTLAFKPSPIASYTQGEKGSSPELALFFFGLFGPNGPLPLHLTEFARERIRHNRDASFSKFADIFHHRFISLFYRAWADARPCVNYDRPESDRYSFFIGSMTGMGQESLRNKTSLPDHTRYFFSGRLASKARNAEGLKAIIEEYFLVPVKIEEFSGRRLKLPPESVWRLGESEENGALGSDAILGESVWDIQNKFRIIIGPVPLKDLNRFLPGKAALSTLRLIVTEYTFNELEWDIMFMLEPDEIRPARLGENHNLGWTSWLGSRQDKKGPETLVMDPDYADQAVLSKTIN